MDYQTVRQVGFVYPEDLRNRQALFDEAKAMTYGFISTWQFLL